MARLNLESHKSRSIAACESFVKLISIESSSKSQVPSSKFFEKSELHFQTLNFKL
jgi:hypothetical protein